MGQKVHPIGFRLGVIKDWQAKWYADKNYADCLQEDLKIRKTIETKYAEGDISRVEIERAANQVTVTIHTARPGIVIGRGGQRVDETRNLLEAVTGKRIRLNIQEIRQPELDAYLVARNIAQQIERRISHRRAMKQAITRAMDGGAKGIKVMCSGRLAGSEYARRETLHQGRVPLHTLRADIDYALAEARTTLGRTGVKVWVYLGDILPESKAQAVEASAAEAEDAVEGEAGVVAAEATAAAAPAPAAEAPLAEEAAPAAEAQSEASEGAGDESGEQPEVEAAASEDTGDEKPDG
ncbi:MAG: 30S ribosomal protein S3 [Chloroflexota bacterium]|nr:30S ribosomal protein S3 [Chloroflexota bacterium]